MQYLNSKCAAVEEEDNEDAMFFRSLAKACQKLTPRTRSIIKMKMYAIMCKAELQEFSFQYDTCVASLKNV